MDPREEARAEQQARVAKHAAQRGYPRCYFPQSNFYTKLADGAAGVVTRVVQNQVYVCFEGDAAEWAEPIDWRAPDQRACVPVAAPAERAAPAAKPPRRVDRQALSQALPEELFSSWREVLREIESRLQSLLLLEEIAEEAHAMFQASGLAAICDLCFSRNNSPVESLRDKHTQ